MCADRFIDREEEVQQIVHGRFVLLNVYGETGIGKTTLLRECRKKWESLGSSYKVFLVDLKDWPGKNRPIDELLRAVIAQAPETFTGVWTSAEQAAGLVVSQLSVRAQQCPTEQPCVILIFDTTEVLQNESEVWEWLEKNLVRPLVLAQNIKMIFSGRTPVRWLDFEVRRHAEPPLRLEPLWSGQAGGPARELALELIGQKGGVFTEAQRQALVKVILDLSFGHPYLIERLAESVCEHPDWAESPGLASRLSAEVVAGFIEEQVFAEIPAEWRVLLWWMSVLDCFDTFLLQTFLNRAVPGLVKGRQEAYFLQGIRLLHDRSILIWEESQGEQFQGVVGKIIRKCFSITRRDDYIRANKAAAEAYRQLMSDYLVDEEDLKRNYQAQAAIYDGRAIAAEAA